jgi:hypothetical protein
VILYIQKDTALLRQDYEGHSAEGGGTHIDFHFGARTRPPHCAFQVSMKVPLSQTKFFDREAFNGNLFVEKKDNKGFSALIVHCLTRHYKTKLKAATRMYLVLDGKGTFTINDEVQSAEKDDMFIISDGDIYEYEGEMKLFEFNIPGTDRDNEERLE